MEVALVLTNKEYFDQRFGNKWKSIFGVKTLDVDLPFFEFEFKNLEKGKLIIAHDTQGFLTDDIKQELSQELKDARVIYFLYHSPAYDKYENLLNEVRLKLNCELCSVQGSHSPNGGYSKLLTLAAPDLKADSWWASFTAFFPPPIDKKLDFLHQFLDPANRQSIGAGNKLKEPWNSILLGFSTEAREKTELLFRMQVESPFDERYIAALADLRDELLRD